MSEKRYGYWSPWNVSEVAEHTGVTLEDGEALHIMRDLARDLIAAQQRVRELERVSSDTARIHYDRKVHWRKQMEGADRDLIAAQARIAELERDRDEYRVELYDTADDLCCLQAPDLTNNELLRAIARSHFDMRKAWVDVAWQLKAAEATIARVRGLVSDWRKPDPLFRSKLHGAPYRSCADELEAALAEPKEGGVMQDSKITLTAEMLDELAAHADRQDGHGDTANITTDELRALIDAARFKAECMQWMGTRIEDARAKARLDAFALVERELREIGADIMFDDDDARVLLYVDDPKPRPMAIGNTLIEAVDAAKGKG